MSVLKTLDELTKPKPRKVKTTVAEGYGYMVSYEVHEGGCLHSRHFPDKHAGEPLIRYETDAWELAEYLANNAKQKIVNVYVINHEFRPTKYPKKFNKYPV